MADRAKTYWQGNHVLGATLTADGTGSGVLGSIKDGLQAPSWYTLALGANPLPHWLAADFGAAKDWDRVAIHISEGSVARSPKDFTIQASDDGIAWDDVAVVANFFGAVAPANVSRWAVAAVNRQVGKRHMRLYFTGAYAGADYVAMGEVFVWDSTLLGSELLADVGTVLRFYDASAQSSQAVLTDKALTPTYGWYNTQHGGTLEVDLGAEKYVGGFDFRAYTSGQYTPDTMKFLVSGDGSRQSWAPGETVDLSALGLVGTNRIAGLALSRIYRTRYFQLVADKQAGKNGCVLWWNLELHETLIPAPPPDPTGVEAGAGKDDPSAIEVRWAQAAGDDNALADIRWTVERRQDGGAWAEVAALLTTPYFVDSGLAAGAYDYRVKAVHAWHARESGLVQTPASVAVPASAGGGGGGPLERGLAA